jgi:hypothetical protein
MFADGLENLIQRQVLLPLLAVVRVVTGTGAIQTQEPGETIGTQFVLKEIKACRSNCSSVKLSMAVMVLAP